MNKTVAVIVAYAKKNQEILISLELPENSSVFEAVQASHILLEHPDISESVEALEGRVGIFGKVVPLSRLVKPGDRIEIYRPLYQDPKIARRTRGTAETKQMKQDKRLAKSLRRANKRAFRKRTQDK